MSAETVVVALAAHRAGLAPIPATDPKAPATYPVPEDCDHLKCVEKRAEKKATWVHLQHYRLSENELRARVNGRIGFVCGAISGNTECLDVEGRFVISDDWPTFARSLRDSDLGRVLDGYAESTPSGGRHFYYRCAEVSGGTALARAEDVDTVDAAGNTKTAQGPILIEYRGEGQFAVAAPTPGYQVVSGGVDSVPTLTSEERRRLHDLCRTFNLSGSAEPIERPERTTTRTEGVLRPGDDYLARHTVGDVLEQHGWTFVRRIGDEAKWRHPTATFPWSGVEHVDNSTFSCFSPTPGLRCANAHQGGYNALQLHVALTYKREDDDTFAEAMRDLAAQGYGESTEDWQQRQTADLYELAGKTPPAAQSSDSTPRSEPDGAPEAPQADWRDLLREKIVLTERYRREARRLLDAEDNAKAILVPYIDWAGDEFVAHRFPEVAVVVQRFAEAGDNVVLLAQYKVGKTTFSMNLTRSLVEGTTFLGSFDVPEPQQVYYLNLEVDERRFQRWLLDIEINAEAQSRLRIANLRGRGLRLIDPEQRAELVEHIRAHNTQALIVDCLAPALSSCGLEENSNTDMGRFLNWLDEVKTAAGVSTTWVVHHRGRGEGSEGGEHGRGASRLDDWADNRILLSKDEHGARYVRTEGRGDHDLSESKLEFDVATRTLNVAVEGMSRAASRLAVSERGVINAVEENPGVNTSELRDVLGGLGVSRNEDKSAGINRALRNGKIHKHKAGRSVGHYPGADHKEVSHLCSWRPLKKVEA